MVAALSFNFTLGLFFIVLVAILWSFSSALIQYLYVDLSFHSPFLVTYISVSLSSFWLPIKLTTTALKKLCYGGSCKQNQRNESASEKSVEMVTYQDIPTSDPFVETITTAVTSHTPDETGLTEKQMESVETPRVDLIRAEPQESVQDEVLPQSNLQLHHRQHNPWTHSDHFRAALYIAPVWFSADWMYVKSLQFTSITSSNVLALTGSSIFTFLFAILTRDESFGWIKVIGILFGVAGSILTGWNDRGDSDMDEAELMGHNLTLSSSFAETNTTMDITSAQWGDLLGLLSAIGHSGYTLQFRILCPHDESLFSMQLLLGYIGLISMVGFSPCVLWQIFNGGAAGGRLHLSWMIFGSLVAKGVFDCMVLDYLWLRAVILTSATVATVGWGLMIPMAIACDVLFWGKTSVLTLYSIIGSLFVLLCFVLVTLGSEDENATRQAIEIDNDGVVDPDKSLHHDVVGKDAQDSSTQSA